VCKLLDFHGHGPLQLFCPTFATPPTHTYRLRSLANDSLLFSSSIQFTSLDLFRRSFIGATLDIWAETPAELKPRGADQGWSTVLKLFRNICVKCLCRCQKKKLSLLKFVPLAYHHSHSWLPPLISLFFTIAF